ncbi:hypothetical protein JW977_01095 [Candidatus Falkowbacteria bacterium]|nr:hypothetical protein [Candidatus Falkowbacteria bacterium]
MWTWKKAKEELERINWLKLVMALFTLIILISYTMATAQNKEMPALAKLNYFYKWAIGAFAVLHEAQRWLFSDNKKQALAIVQGEIYVTLFIMTTVSLLFLNVINSELYPTLPQALNELIELSIWVAGAFGFSRVSKNFSENNKTTNLAKLADSLKKMGYKLPESQTENPK